MRMLIAVSCLVCLPGSAVQLAAQGTGPATVHVRVLSQNRPVHAAVVRSGTVASHSDSTGLAMLRLAAGMHVVVATRLGLGPDSATVDLRPGADTTITLELKEQAGELRAVTVSATRAERRVTDEPTRVDVVNREEIEEVAQMTPGSVAMLLSETGGLRVQTTSAAIGSASVRVQGLRGKYTQLLSDGLPLYGLSPAGLGLLQIPPVDLRQVEIIKGAASALYGPSALGGVVNLLSRRPHPGSELLLNQTTQLGTDLVGWNSGELTPALGYTLVAGGHRQAQRFLGSADWADVAGYDRGEIRPRLFWRSSNQMSLMVTAGYSAENRRGGGPSVAQSVDTRRGDGGAVGTFVLGPSTILSIRSSATVQDETRRFADLAEPNRRTTLFTEASLAVTSGSHVLVGGAGYGHDALHAPRTTRLDYAFDAPFAFGQDSWSPRPWIGTTVSARLDQHSRYGSLVSPRLSVLLRPVDRWTIRVSVGGGAFAPTPFVEESDDIPLSRVRALTGVGAEHATSLTLDVGSVVGPVEFNVAAYASEVRNAVAVLAASPTDIELRNTAGPARVVGTDVFGRYRRGDFSLTGIYAFLDATEIDVASRLRRDTPLTPRDWAVLMAGWEWGDESRFVLEAIHTGRQALEDDPYRSTSHPYTEFGALLSVRIGKTVVFANGENLTDVRLSHFEALLRPTPGLGGRMAVPPWAPLMGRLVNAGVRVDF